MRITGGTLRGRTLRAPEGMDTRPTSDRVREALFNILLHHDWGEEIGDPLAGGVVLDAFAGTGALGIEALSHGAAQAFFFEKDRTALSTLKTNLAALIPANQAAVWGMDVTRATPLPAATQAPSLVFLDPPYRKDLIPQALAALKEKGWITPRALIVTETAKKETLDLPDYEEILSRTYGDTTVGFWKAKAV